MIKKTLGILFHSGHNQHDGLNLRRWFFFYIAYLASLATLATLAISYLGSAPHFLWLFALYLFYMSICCTFFPAPTAWIVLLLASPVVNITLLPDNFIILNSLNTIISVSALGAVGTAVANLNEYHIFTFLLRFGHVHKVRSTRFYQTANRWFTVSPFLLLTTFSFLPVPVDIVRWLAISHQYRRDLYCFASFVGRLFRYALLATAAACLKLDWFAIAGIQIFFILLVLFRYLPRLRKHSFLDKIPDVDKVDSIAKA